MKISSIAVGNLKANCYLLEKENQCLLIDPGDDYEKILKFIQNKNVIGILITHSHFDHIASVRKLVDQFGYLVYNYNNLKVGTNKIGNFTFEVIETFGHTMDSLSFYFREEKKMFTGDFLFSKTIGRCDFIESNPQEMIKSIQKIKKYDQDIEIYPGHGKTTTLKKELQYNPYFKI